MAVPRLTIYLDETNGTAPNFFGHMWIKLTDSNGTVRHYGFYPGGTSADNAKPKDTIGLSRNGEVILNKDQYRVIDHASKVSGYTFTITQAQHDSIKNSANATHPKYDALGYMCVEWVESTLQTVGFQFQVSWWESAGMGIFFDDYTLIKERIRDSLEKYGNFATQAVNWKPTIGTPELAYYWYHMPGVWVQSIADCGMPCGKDPLIIDFSNDGLDASNKKKGIPFDFNNDGKNEMYYWVGPDEGFLVVDINQNGKVDSGAELFGNSTLLSDGSYASHGYHAILEYDTNEDMKISVEDASYHTIMVWRDLNQNGKSSKNEIFSLQEVGIERISIVPDLELSEYPHISTVFKSKVHFYDASIAPMYDIILHEMDSPPLTRTKKGYKDWSNSYKEYKLEVCSRKPDLCSSENVKSEVGFNTGAHQFNDSMADLVY